MDAEMNLQNERLKAGYRSTANKYLWACYVLLLIATIAPIYAPFDSMPSFESVEVWFQRSGALTTVFALLTTLLRDMGMRTLHKPGHWGDALKLEVLSEVEARFEWIFWTAFTLTIIGTVVWGYGDTLYKFVILHQR